MDDALVENRFLDPGTTKSIDQFVERVLSDLGDPEPPLDLVTVLDLLRLDKNYYSSTDPSLLKRTVHRLKIAGKQVVKRPLILADAIRKFELRALWLPDHKRILIDSEMPKLKQRWGEAHEIGHSLIPWHEPLVHGDRQRTLSISCKNQIEAEANYTAGRLLFLQDRFVDEVRSSNMNFKRIQGLHKTYGNTMTSTLWRTVECLAVPAFGMVSMHPHEVPQDGEKGVRHFPRSASFQKSFAGITAEELFLTLGEFCYGRRGPIGTGSVVLGDHSKRRHVFFVECFHNGYDTLTLGIHEKTHPPSISLRHKK